MKRDNLCWYESHGRVFCMVLDTGVFLECDPIVRDILAHGPDTDRPDLIAAVYPKLGEAALAEALDELRRYGLLGERPAAEARRVEGRRFENLWLNVAHDCNLRCKYCYASGGNYRGKPGLMPVKVARQAIDWWLSRLSPDRAHVLTFFGGEPLLNFPVIEWASRYCKERIENLTLQLTTNGTVLSRPILEFFLDLGSFPMISVDGGPEVQDKNRPFQTGAGTYSVIAANVEELRRHFRVLEAKMTITRNNVARARDDINHLFEMGFTEVKWETVSTKDRRLALTQKDFDTLSEQIVSCTGEFIDNLLGGKERILGNVMRFINVIHNRLLNNSCSFAAANGVIVSADGRLHPCHRLIGDEAYTLGTLGNGLDPERVAALTPKPPPERYPCSECGFAALCGGGCPQEAIVFNDDFNKPYAEKCEYLRTIMRQAIRTYGELYVQRPQLLDHLFRKREGRQPAGGFSYPRPSCQNE